MIKFKRRRLHPWVGSEGYTNYEDSPSLLEFQDEEELLLWIKQAFPNKSEEPFKLVIEDNSVIWGAVIGWIENIE